MVIWVSEEKYVTHRDMTIIANIFSRPFQTDFILTIFSHFTGVCSLVHWPGIDLTAFSMIVLQCAKIKICLYIWRDIWQCEANTYTLQWYQWPIYFEKNICAAYYIVYGWSNTCKYKHAILNMSHYIARPSCFLKLTLHYVVNTVYWQWIQMLMLVEMLTEIGSRRIVIDISRSFL